MTAVEWIEAQLSKEWHLKYIAKNLIEKAKEIEKQQIIEAHGNKKRTKSDPGSIVTYGYTYTGEMYYNDKFKKDERNDI